MRRSWTEAAAVVRRRTPTRGLCIQTRLRTISARSIHTVCGHTLRFSATFKGSSSMRMRGLVLILASGLAVSCSGGSAGSPTAPNSSPTAPNSTITRIDVAPSPLVRGRTGMTIQFTATAIGSTGDAVVPQPTVIWSSGQLTVATIASTGPGTAVATRGSSSPLSGAVTGAARAPA